MGSSIFTPESKNHAGELIFPSSRSTTTYISTGFAVEFLGWLLGLTTGAFGGRTFTGAAAALIGFHAGGGALDAAGFFAFAFFAFDWLGSFSFS